MIVTSRTANPHRCLCAAVFVGLIFLPAISLIAEPPAAPPQVTPAADQAASPVCNPGSLGSPFIPVDSWVYPAVYRLYSLGYLDHVFLDMRPWTRASLSHMLEDANAQIQDAADNGESPETEQAKEIYAALMYELAPDIQGPCGPHQGNARIESAYSTFLGISGTPLDDSFHLGQTIINNYGRPFENGLNNYTGASGYVTMGRFAIYARGELQHSPSAAGYSEPLAETLSGIDLIVPFINPVTNLPYPQATIPMGPIADKSQGRFLEAYVSYQFLNHVFSFGKQDEWLGPAKGASFAFSNNAQNFYAFHINRIEPLDIPGLSRIIGPFRYEFLIGSLRGHTLVPNPNFTGDTAAQPNVITPGDPWVHVEKISFKPTSNLEFGFERTALFGGQGHQPVTLHSFLRSFFSLSAAGGAKKNGSSDPGARFGAFDFTYRLPYFRNWLTLYTDGEVHDDISPIDAPRRASWRPGLFLSHVPRLPRLSLRGEAVWTDPPVSTSFGGRFMYWEYIEKQGYTNQGQIFGDWIGREAKGGQAWATWQLSGNQWIQASWRHQKAAKDFIPGGTTLNDVDFQAVKRIGKDFAIDGNFKYESWKAPVYLPGQQHVTATTIQLIWYPQHKVSF